MEIFQRRLTLHGCKTACKTFQGPGEKSFDELLGRIREIRASERRFYQKITDIYRDCSIDYLENAEQTQQFYKAVQNKLEWAIIGKTAPELNFDRVNADLPNVGLQTWKNAPNGKILKSDMSVAKNYLHKHEIKELERIVSMYLDYAEQLAHQEYEKFRIIQDRNFESDFDKNVKKMLKKDD